MALKSFNLRVYGILIVEGKVLLIEEEKVEKEKKIKLIKFPGGGLELGEGTIEGLKREFLEEIGLVIEVETHFYTTDFFQLSQFNPKEQLISIYYKVKPLQLDKINIKEKKIIKCFWVELGKINKEIFFTLPIDKKVGDLLNK